MARLPAQPVARARSMQQFRELVETLGGEPEEMLTCAGLSSAALDVPETWIPLRGVIDAYELAARSTGCDAFGLRLAGARGLSYLGPLILSFGPALKFGASADCLVLDRLALSQRNPVSDRDMVQFLKRYLDARVAAGPDDTCAVVTRLLRDLIPTGAFTIDIVADQLGMHRRTLQRRLARSGANYAQLLDTCRAEMALDYLEADQRAMVDLAHSLGYSDQSAFNHAFRRWYGTSPREWRAARVAHDPMSSEDNRLSLNPKC
jgi:AraC-like DNA-binding protein